MTDHQFTELRRYREAESSCIDDGGRPLASLISNSWVREVVPRCWGITAKGIAAFDAVVSGATERQPDRNAG